MKQDGAQQCGVCGYSYDWRAWAALTSPEAARKWPFEPWQFRVLSARAVERMKDVIMHRCYENAGHGEDIAAFRERMTGRRLNATVRGGTQ